MSADKPELPAIYTTSDGSFLHPLVRTTDHGRGIRSHRELIERVGEHLPEFGFPYAALTDEGLLYRYVNIDEFNLCRVDPDTLAEGILGWVRSGNAINPITGLVQFSPVDLYPAAMKDISDRLTLVPVHLDVDPALAADPNWIAYNEDLRDGRLARGAWVAYIGGKRIETADTQESLFGLMDERHPGESYFHAQAGVEPRTVRMRSPHSPIDRRV